MRMTATPRRARLLTPLLVVGIAVATMVVGLGHPDRIFFDETYYVNDARDLLASGVEEGFVVHPPLGKLLIAAGIWLLGDTPQGWRIMGGVLGVATVWLTYLVARRLGLRLAAAGLAGLALALDGVLIAQARTAMLDVHLAFFVVLGTYALVRDLDRVRAADDAALAMAARDRAGPTHAGADEPLPVRGEPRDQATGDQAALPVGQEGRPDGPVEAVAIASGVYASGRTATPPEQVPSDRPGRSSDREAGLDPDRENDPGLAPSTEPGRGPAPAAGQRDSRPPRAALPRVARPWLVLAGVAFGAGVAVKWSGALALVAAGAVWLGSELVRRRRVTGRAPRRPWSALVLGGLALGVVPVATYAATWIPWYVAFDQSWIAQAHCGGAGDDLDCDGLLGRTRALASYHERMVVFHLELEADHTYRAEAWNWPIQRRPVVFYYETCSQDRQERVEVTDSDGEVTVPEPCRVAPGQAAEIIDLGNPASWWLLLAGLPVLGMLLRRRDRAALVVTAFYAAQFLPWLLASRPVFNFYTVPLVPFVALALALVVDRVAARDAWIRASLLGLATATLVLAGTVVAEALGRDLVEPARWYAAGLAAMLGGAIVRAPGRDALRDPGGAAPGIGSRGPARRWPTVAVGALVLVAGLYFLPLWTGIALPEAWVRAHWWLPTWT